MKYTVFLVLSCLVTGLPAQSLLEEANAAYEAQDYATAAANYELLREEGLTSAALYLRQGNAYLESGDLGRAILAYERGLRLRPGDRDLKNNLKFAEERLPQRLADLPGFFLLRWWKWIGSRIGATTLFILAICVWWVAVGTFAFWFFRRQRLSERRRFLLLPASVLATILAITCWAAGQHRLTELNRKDLAVLVVPTAAIRVAPGPDATLEREITTGLRLRIVDTFKEEYVKVELRDGKQGWLPKTAIEII